MAMRLGGLADLDPTAVPLPVGTEVTTRVDRVIDGGTREKGASARVTSVDGDRVVRWVLFRDERTSSIADRRELAAKYEAKLKAAGIPFKKCVVRTSTDSRVDTSYSGGRYHADVTRWRGDDLLAVYMTPI